MHIEKGIIKKSSASDNMEEGKVISLANYAPFALDISKIGDRSVSKDVVDLPYSGPLPESIANPTSACIRFLVRVPDDPFIALVTAKADGNENIYPVEASADEVRQVMDGFWWGDGCGCEDYGEVDFDDSRCEECDKPCGRAISDTGLDAYSAGMWTAHYVDWINVGGRIRD